MFSDRYSVILRKVAGSTKVQTKTEKGRNAQESIKTTCRWPIQIMLAVAINNTDALKRYERHGFTRYGIEPRVLRIGDRFIDEHLMVKDLRL